MTANVACLCLQLQNNTSRHLLESHHTHLSRLLLKAEEQRPPQASQHHITCDWGITSGAGAPAKRSTRSHPIILDVVSGLGGGSHGASDHNDLAIASARISLQSRNPLTLGDLLHRARHNQDTLVSEYDPDTHQLSAWTAHRTEQPLARAGARVVAQLTKPPPSEAAVTAQAVCSQAMHEHARGSSQPHSRWGSGEPLVSRTSSLAVRARSASPPALTCCASMLSPHATVLLRPEQLRPGTPFGVHTAGQATQPHSRPLPLSATAVACYKQLLDSWPLAGASDASVYLAAPAQQVVRPAAGPSGVGSSQAWRGTQLSQNRRPMAGPGPSQPRPESQPVQRHPWMSQGRGF
jgi:hypothetical protein